jgi:hypothetical protein
MSFHDPVAALERMTHQEIEDQLGRLLESPFFSRSTRYPALLRYLVEQSQQGNAAKLKERLIGIEVFHRLPDYDTNADPVVRVTAGEVRRRIAQYYQESEHAAELRIELPIGSYVPRFLPPHAAVLLPEEAEFHELESPAPFEDLPLDADAAVLPSHIAESHPRSNPIHAEAAVAEAPPPAAAAGHHPHRVTVFLHALRAHLLLTILVSALATLCLLGTLYALSRRAQDRSIAELWAPMQTQDRLLLVLGDHSLDDKGQPIGVGEVNHDEGDTLAAQMNRHSQVPLEDVITLDVLHALLARNHRSYWSKGAAEATLADLRSGPVILFAGFDNRWSMQLSQKLPFKLIADFPHNYFSIVDAHSPQRHWSMATSVPFNRIDSDYGIVARYHDTVLDQNVLLLAGIGSTGTAAATEFVTESRYSREVASGAPPGWKNGNFEVVFYTPVVEGQPGAPHIVASAYW